MTDREFLEVVRELYWTESWPKPLHRLLGAALVDGGAEIREAASAVGTTTASLNEVLRSNGRLQTVLGISPRDIDRSHRERAIRTLGQLLVGHAAERAFEDIFREEMETNELEVRDLREGRTDTDYRVYNGQGRPV